MLDDIAEALYRYAGPAWAWLANLVLFFFDGLHPLTIIATLCTIWWTVERARTERARRKLAEMQQDHFDEYVRETRGPLSRLMDRLTKPDDLKD